MRSTFTVLLILTAVFVQGQDVTGVWQGHFHATNQGLRSSVIEERYKYEVQIAQKEKALEAVTYSYLSTLFYGKAAAIGTVNPKTGKVLVQEIKLLDVHNKFGDGVCIMTCFLQYSKSGNEEFLEGSYTSMSTTDSSNCGRGTVFLRKVPASDFYKEPFLEKREKEIAEVPKTAPAANPAKSPAAGPRKSTATGPVTTGKSSGTPVAKTPPAQISGTKTPPTAAPSTAKSSTPQKTAGGAPSKPATGQAPSSPPLAKTITPANLKPVHTGDSLNGPASGSGMGKKFAVITPEVLLKRTNHLVQTISVNTNEVVLNIYDDGVIDHDTISVYLDKKQVISHAMLTDRPIILKLHLDENDAYHELVMVAENEGDIPPNTSLMIVQAGDNRYEVRITSTEQKNAVVIFKYEKKN